jgi:large subunit ribosomal protein L18
VYKSSKAVYTQIIDDEKGVTICAHDSRKSKGKTPLDRAKETGAEIAKLATGKGIKEVVFDRGGYEYKGKIQVVAEAAREAGLKF